MKTNTQRRLLAWNNGRHNTVMTSTQNFEIICNAASINPTQPTDATYTETRKKLLRRVNNNKSLENTWNVTTCRKSVTQARYSKASMMLYDEAENNDVECNNWWKTQNKVKLIRKKNKSQSCITAQHARPAQLRDKLQNAIYMRMQKNICHMLSVCGSTTNWGKTKR